MRNLQQGINGGRRKILNIKEALNKEPERSLEYKIAVLKGKIEYYKNRYAEFKGAMNENLCGGCLVVIADLEKELNSLK